MRPNSACTRLKASATPVWSATSTATGSVLLPTAAEASPSAPGLRSSIATRAPSAAKSRAVAKPIPLAAPVITVNFPASLSLTPFAG